MLDREMKTRLKIWRVASTKREAPTASVVGRNDGRPSAALPNESELNRLLEGAWTRCYKTVLQTPLCKTTGHR